MCRLSPASSNHFAATIGVISISLNFGSFAIIPPIDEYHAGEWGCVGGVTKLQPSLYESDFSSLQRVVMPPFRVGSRWHQEDCHRGLCGLGEPLRDVSTVGWITEHATVGPVERLAIPYLRVVEWAGVKVEMELGVQYGVGRRRGRMTRCHRGEQHVPPLHAA